jgi:hypothetical protein
VQEAHSERVLSFDGGLARRAEIAAQLAAAAGSEQGAAPVWYLALPSLASAVLGLALLMARRRWGSDESPEPDSPRWLRLLLPGLGSIERGAGFSAFIALLGLAALLLMLPVLRPGVPIPWGFDPGNGLLWLLFVLGLLLLYGLRLQRELRPQE